MRILDPSAMSTPRKSCCEWCGRYCRRDTERHHITPKGMGGGNRLDHPWNMIDLGGAFDCGCHARADARQIPDVILYLSVAGREQVGLQSVLDFVQWTLRQPKERGEAPKRTRKNRGMK